MKFNLSKASGTPAGLNSSAPEFQFILYNADCAMPISTIQGYAEKFRKRRALLDCSYRCVDDESTEEEIEVKLF